MSAFGGKADIRPDREFEAVGDQGKTVITLIVLLSAE